MRKVLVLIGLCAVVALALTVTGQAPRNDIDAIMKDVGTTIASISAAVTASDSAKIGTDAAKLESLFKEAETFFTKQKIDDASKMSKEVAAAAGEIAKSKDGTKVKTEVQSKCKGCHAIYRTQDPVTKAYSFKAKQ